ncbi:hypothetical protein M501DRAFT_999568 [Patellaria atrata CBS 101060]|uniref:Uncharacterized protein n=1 Tax=Patellaria atrata CBS 101060 TaxID=1346257 RepID=A0A9P4VMC2_9PEZI|nr:hypothetical protein M501DRAFT_999568 [Patellaria atrata CBS 101060]
MQLRTVVPIILFLTFPERGLPNYERFNQQRRNHQPSPVHSNWKSTTSGARASTVSTPQYP